MGELKRRRLLGKTNTPGKLGEAPPAKPTEAPPHWPENVVVDTAKWVSWLPDGWGQGIKTPAGKTSRRVYLNPEGKMYYHRVDIEKALGRSLVATDDTAEAPSAAVAAVSTPA